MLRRLWRLLRPSLEVAWITPELALGPRFEKRQVGALARAGIGSVIDVRSEASDDEEALAKHDIRLYHLPVDDRQAPTQTQLEEATPVGAQGDRRRAQDIRPLPQRDRAQPLARHRHPHGHGLPPARRL